MGTRKTLLPLMTEVTQTDKYTAEFSPASLEPALRATEIFCLVCVLLQISADYHQDKERRLGVNLSYVVIFVSVWLRVKRRISVPLNSP